MRPSPSSSSQNTARPLDLAATFTRAAGLTPPADLDGQDLAAVVRGDSGHETLHWDCGWQWAVRTDRWKLSWCDGQSETAKEIAKVEHTATGDGIFLADITADPGELINVASQYPGIVDELTRAHSAWCADVGLSDPTTR